MPKCKLGNLINLGSWSSYKGKVAGKKLNDENVSKEKYWHTYTQSAELNADTGTSYNKLHVPPKKETKDFAIT